MRTSKRHLGASVLKFEEKKKEKKRVISEVIFMSFLKKVGEGALRWIEISPRPYP